MAAIRSLLTFHEYLAWEEHQERRHEFVDGRVRRVGGETLRHGTLVENVYCALRAPAIAAGCRSYAFSAKVETPAGRVYYPDVVVGCGAFSYDDQFVRTPSAVVEVTSPRTASVDRGEKREQYREISSLRTYVVVEQAARRMECYTRDARGGWAHAEVSDVAGVGEFAIPGLDAVLTLDGVYEDTDVAPPTDLRATVAPHRPHP